MATLKELIQKAGEVAVLKAHPVGSYFITEEDKNPNEILGLSGGGNSMDKINRQSIDRSGC